VWEYDKIGVLNVLLQNFQCDIYIYVCVCVYLYIDYLTTLPVIQAI
jgi:hypothetical protein